MAKDSVKEVPFPEGESSRPMLSSSGAGWSAVGGQLGIKDFKADGNAISF